MRLLDASNAGDYLRKVGFVSTDEQLSIRELAGGVSNVVLHVGRGQGGGEDFVLKQARGQLRVAQPWFCSVERIWREVQVLRVCGDVLARSESEERPLDSSLTRRASIAVPAVLFEDRENYAFAMTAAPLGHRTWKADLLAGRFDPHIAAACGELLGRLHAGTWQDDALSNSLGDRTFFDDLRVDPYYRHIAGVHEDLRPAIEQLIASLDAYPRCLVHGDFSPKNLLVWDGAKSESAPNLMLIDCEVGHFGDPAFDLGFFLSHLVLKAVFHESDRPVELAQTFLDAYAHVVRDNISHSEYDMLQQRAAKNLAGCLLARVDGKSPVEYLTDAAKRDAVRRMARELFSRCDGNWESVWEIVRN